MKQYSIAWISFFDHVMHMDTIWCHDETYALEEAFFRLTGTRVDDFNIEIGQLAFDCEGMVGAVEVKNDAE